MQIQGISIDLRVLLQIFIMLSMREDSCVEVSYQKILVGNLISRVLVIQWVF